MTADPSEPRWRVEELAARAELSVDTIRFYQKRRLLPPPQRSGRIAWYGPEHLERLARIRELRGRGLTLALIGRIVDGDLDPTDAPLAAAVARADAEAPEEFLTLAELAERSGVPLALLDAVARENLLVARVHDGEARYTNADIAIVQQGLRLLEQGLPLPALLALANEHHEATREIAETAVGLFDQYVRAPLRARPTFPTTRRRNSSSRRSARSCRRSPRSSRTTSGASCSRSRRSTSSRSARRASSQPSTSRPRAGSKVGRREPHPERRRAARHRRQAPRRRSDVRPHRAALRRAEPRAHVPHGRRLAAARGRSARAPPASRVLDLACGTGDLCRTLRAAGLTPVGVDFSTGMLRAAHTDAPLVRADALRLPFADATFDGITCGFALRNFAALAPVLAECGRVVRPGGRVALLDVAEPAGPFVRFAHGAWFRHVVPFVGGLVSDRAAYRYLPASTAYLPPVPEMLALVVDAGIVDVSRRTLGFGAAQLITGTRAE